MKYKIFIKSNEGEREFPLPPMTEEKADKEIRKHEKINLVKREYTPPEKKKPAPSPVIAQESTKTSEAVPKKGKSASSKKKGGSKA